MDKLLISETAFSPEVILDPNNNSFSIIGESRPENVSKFYNDIFKWFEQFLLSDTKIKQLTIKIEFTYFNTATAKIILELINFIQEKCKIKSIDFKVTWIYEGMDDDMLDAGKLMETLSNVSFNFIEK